MRQPASNPNNISRAMFKFSETKHRHVETAYWTNKRRKARKRAKIQRVSRKRNRK